MQKTFTQNWHNEPEHRRRCLRRFSGSAVRALEIGCFEGRSTCWLLDNILTHEGAHLDCVDPYGFSGGDSDSRAEGEACRHPNRAVIMRRFLGNIAEYGDRVRHWPLFSDEFFQRPELGPYQIAIIDGGHSAMQALRDLLHAWQVLAVGGVMVVDDIKWPTSHGPRKAYEAFLSCVPPGDVLELHRGYIAIVEKLK
jgi:predicted O-methyltransferase YrrM